MSSLQLTLDVNFELLARKFSEIVEFAENSIKKRKGYKYTTKVDGYLSFIKTSADYRFENLEELKDALIEQDMSDIYLWRINLEIIETKKDTKYEYSSLVGFSFNQDHRYDDALQVKVSSQAFSKARAYIDSIALILDDAKYVRISEPSQDEIDKEELDSRRDDAILDIIEILEHAPDLQARISKPFGNEKEVQNFLFPVLKSHFPDMQEEDYLSKVAGTASKPDFGIEELGIAIEVKFTSNSKNFKQLKTEINDDSRQYFGKGSPFTTMIVFIYNGSSAATPVNYVPDLEHIDVISKIIISPNMLPRS